MVFANMANDVRKKYAIDDRVIKQYDEGNRDVLTLEEVER